MKNLMTMAAIAALVLTSCSNDSQAPEGASTTPDGAITFRMAMTKTTTTTLGSMTDFSVSAGKYNTSSNVTTSFDFMSNQPVVKTIQTDGTNSTSKWTYGPLKFWPTNPTPTYAFYAYSPAGSRNMDTPISTNTADGAHFNYTVPLNQAVTSEDPKTPVDFLIAAKTIVPTSGAYPATISLNFVHALSRVTFSANNSSQNVQFAITGIQLLNLAQTGTATLYTDDENESNITWSNNTEQTHTYIASLPPAGVYVPYSSTSTYTSLTSENEGVLVLPQSSQTKAIYPAQGSYVAVTYKVYDSAGAAYISETKYFPFSQTFTAGKQYNFQFTLNGGKTLLFDVGSVTGWAEPSTDIAQ